MSAGCTFTVFTPTFNRAHTLPRAYAALQQQTFRDFEWLIVDDGSTDGTEALVQSWQRAADFPIRYIWQPNGGKHTAHNRAVAEAHGRLFAPIDSDDACTPEALEHLYYYWNTIPFAQQAGFAGIGVLARYAEGGIVGTPYPAAQMDTNHLEMVYRLRMRGDKWYCLRTELLRQFPYPQVDGWATHFNEATLYMRLARHYQLRYVNDPLLIVYADAGSLSRPTGDRRVLNQRIAATFVPHYRTMLNEQMDYAPVAPLYFLRAAAHYVRFAYYRGIAPWRQVRALENWPARLLWLAALPIGTAIYLADGRRPLAGGAAPQLDAPLHSETVELQPALRPQQCLFTVFTAAYNRPETLRRVYASLAAQTLRDFEWIIVDDGSGPAVRALVEALQGEADFPIVYIGQPNQGKHAAHNRAVAAARGIYFAPLDDDDTVAPNALERTLAQWHGIPEGERGRYVAVMGLCTDQAGKLLGARFPSDIFDSDYITYFYRQRIPGERWGSYRTEVLRDYPYPIAAGRSAYMLEGVTWLRMARRYKTRYVNEVWRTWYLGHYSVSSKQARVDVDYPRIGPTQVIVYGQQLNEMIDQLPQRPRFLWMSAAHFARFAFHAGYALPQQWRLLHNARARLLWLTALPLGAAYWLRDRVVTWQRARTRRTASAAGPGA